MDPLGGESLDRLLADPPGLEKQEGRVSAQQHDPVKRLVHILQIPHGDSNSGILRGFFAIFSALTLCIV